MHGANRLGSNSLLEAVVFASRIAEDIVGQDIIPCPPPRVEGVVARRSNDDKLETQLRAKMAQYVGVLRDADGLNQALRIIKFVLENAVGPSLHNMTATCFMIASAAKAQHESRRAHFRTDYPLANPALARRSYFTLEQAMKLAQVTQC